jgi:hypothetical protein
VNRFVQVGRDMWSMLNHTFRVVMRENNAAYPADKTKVWAGFIAAAAGSMAADLGKENAKTVLQGILNAVDGAVPTQETCAAPDPAPAGCEEWWHLKPYGYAPGGYTMKCPHCQVTVWHVDKRARCCKQCAIAFYESAQSAQNRSPEHG